jgi:hypothetical protein
MESVSARCPGSRAGAVERGPHVRLLDAPRGWLACSAAAALAPRVNMVRASQSPGACRLYCLLTRAALGTAAPEASLRLRRAALGARPRRGASRALSPDSGLLCCCLSFIFYFLFFYPYSSSIPHLSTLLLSVLASQSGSSAVVPAKRPAASLALVIMRGHFDDRQRQRTEGVCKLLLQTDHATRSRRGDCDRERAVLCGRSEQQR